MVFVHWYRVSDFNGIFDALDSSEFDCVTSGTTVTGSRARLRRRSAIPPYLISGRALAVDTSRLPEVTSIDDLEGPDHRRAAGQHQPADRQPAGRRREGRAGPRHDYGSIRSALRDLSTGRCDAFMKLGRC